MPRMVTLVKDLVLEEVPAYKRDELTMHRLVNMPPIGPVSVRGSDTLLECDIETVCMPIARLFHMDGKKRVEQYIAYTPRVEELLQVPFKTMIETNERNERWIGKLLETNGKLNAALFKVDNARFWRRLKYAFTGERP